ASLVGALLLVSGLLLLHVAWSIRRSLAISPTDNKASPASEAKFAQEAQAYAAAGRFLAAAHQMELAVLDLLLQRRVLELTRSEPNRTLRRRLLTALLPEGERAELLSLLDRLERQWFRDRADERGLFDAWWQLYARFERLPERA